MKVQSVQPTPNPNAFKFVVDQSLTSHGAKNYPSLEDARGNDLAEQLFAIDGVDTLFFLDNFVTVSMVDSADWRAVHDRVVKTLDATEGTGASTSESVAGANQPAPSAAPNPTGDPGLLQRINDLLDDRVRPALAGDGGGLEVVALDGKALHIRYQGACGSCPSAAAGTLHAIENLIHTEIDDQVEVIPA